MEYPDLVVETVRGDVPNLDHPSNLGIKFYNQALCKNSQPLLCFRRKTGDMFAVAGVAQERPARRFMCVVVLLAACPAPW